MHKVWSDAARRAAAEARRNGKIGRDYAGSPERWSAADKKKEEESYKDQRRRARIMGAAALGIGTVGALAMVGAKSAARGRALQRKWQMESSKISPLQDEWQHSSMNIRGLRKRVNYARVVLSFVKGM
jgi:hypothetical protein